MKTKMNSKWVPSERFYELALSRGIPREWIGHQIPEFRLYWIERGTLGCWDSTLLNRVTKLWESVDKSRMYRVSAESGFAATILKVENNEITSTPITRKQMYKSPEEMAQDSLARFEQQRKELLG